MENTEERAGQLIAAPHSRRNFLKGAIGSAGLLALVATAGSPVVDGAAYARANLAGMNDVDILNFALTLEHLEATFYKQAVSGGKLTSFSRPILTAVRDHEVAHVEFLTKAINSASAGAAVKAQSSYNFGDMSSEMAILKTALVLEGVGVGAYTGAAPLLQNKDYLSAAGSIEQVEARHHAALRWLNDQTPAQEAFGASYSVAKVKEMVAPILGG